MKLNGWQRLWIVGSVLWLGVLVVYIAPVFLSPRPMEEYHKAFVRALPEASQEAFLPRDYGSLSRLLPGNEEEIYRVNPDRLLKNSLRYRMMDMRQHRETDRLTATSMYNFLCKTPRYAPTTGHELCFRPEVSDTDRTRVVQEYDDLSKPGVYTDRLQIVGFVFILWTVTCAIVYGLGVVVRWVLRGFQHP